MPTSTSALPGTTILNLPIAVSLDGSEWSPVVQGGTTKRTQTADITNVLGNIALVLASSAPSTQSNARQLAAQGLVTITDGGAGGSITVSVGSTGLSVIGTQSTASSTSVGNIVGTADQILRISSAGSSLAFGQVNLGSSNAVSSVLGTNFGGTGSSGLTAYQLILGGSVSSSPLLSVTPGTSGYVLTYGTSVTAPSWQASPTGTVTIGSAGQMTYYSSNGNSIVGSTYANISSGSVTLGLASSATGKLLLASSAGGTTTFTPSSNTVTLTFPITTTTIIGADTTNTLTGKTFDTAGSSNSFRIGGVVISTASSILDTIGSSRGQLLYRSSNVWSVLTAGTSTQFLTSGSSPSWVSAITNIATTYPISGGTITTSGTLTFTGPSNSGRLTYTSTIALSFAPYNGDLIKINGAVVQIPSSGILGLGNPNSVFLNGSATTLASSTFYYVYGFLNGSNLTADFSTTTHIPSTATGNVGTEIKSGDNTRSLIGAVTTSSLGVFYGSDIQTASWFNRRNKTGNATQSLASSGIDVAIPFVCWSDESLFIGTVGFLSNTNSSAITVWQDRIDTVNAGQTSQGTIAAPNAQVTFNSLKSIVTTEGSHSYDSVLTGTAGTATAGGTSSVIIRG